jgi:hypothetical protein
VGLMPSQEYNEQLLHLHLIELDRIGATKIISPSLKLYEALKASDILDKREDATKVVAMTVSTNQYGRIYKRHL